GIELDHRFARRVQPVEVELVPAARALGGQVDRRAGRRIRFGRRQLDRAVVLDDGVVGVTVGQPADLAIGLVALVINHGIAGLQPLCAVDRQGLLALRVVDRLARIKGQRRRAAGDAVADDGGYQGLRRDTIRFDRGFADGGVVMDVGDVYRDADADAGATAFAAAQRVAVPGRR